VTVPFHEIVFPARFAAWHILLYRVAKQLHECNKYGALAGNGT